MVDLAAQESNYMNENNKITSSIEINMEVTKSNQTKSNLLELWKKQHESDVQHLKYETIVREKEKQII